MNLSENTQAIYPHPTKTKKKQDTPSPHRKKKKKPHTTNRKNDYTNLQKRQTENMTTTNLPVPQRPKLKILPPNPTTQKTEILDFPHS